MAAVVNTFLTPGAFQIEVHCATPSCPPEDKLILAVPTGGDGVLPIIPGAFRIFGYSLQSLRLSHRGGDIDLFFPSLY